MSSGFYGTSYDRFVQRTDDSKAHKLKSAYWTTKQAMITKLGRKQDQNIVASDADLDAKLELFKSVQTTCRDLSVWLNRYQETVCYLSQAENEMGRFLKQNSLEDKTQAGKIMSAVGKALSHSAQQRLLLRAPLDRLQQEVKTFRHRAISDTVGTLKRMESSRTEYRGALLWMKNVSEELDPDTYKQLEKFRCVQTQVRKNKAVFDRLKIDTMQKIDLLSASRCNMLSHVLASYQNSLLNFLERTSHTMVAVAERFKGYQYYEFSVLKHLRQDSRRLAGRGEESGEDETSTKSKEHTTQNTDTETSGQPNESGPTEEELDRQLDELFTADNTEEFKVDDFGQFQTNPTTQSANLLAGADGGVPAEHRDILNDLFASTDTPQHSDSQNWLDQLLPSSNDRNSQKPSFTTEWNAVFKQLDSNAPPLDSSLSADTGQKLSELEHDPWAQFGSSSVLPSRLLEQQSNFGSHSNSDLNLPISEPKIQQEEGLTEIDNRSRTSGSSTGTNMLPRRMDSNRSQKPQTSMDAWMSLFSDLGPLGNPDSLSKKEGQISDA